MDSNRHAAVQRHWSRSLRLVAVLLTIWFLASFGCGILLRPWLDRFTLPGTHFPLGFWFAQQGAISIFIVLLAVYVRLAARIDRTYQDERGES